MTQHYVSIHHSREKKSHLLNQNNCIRMNDGQVYSLPASGKFACKIARVHTLFAANALMQFPRANKDLLMLAPSLSLAPRLLVTVALSEPAKSMSDILALVTSADRPAVRAFW